MSSLSQNAQRALDEARTNIATTRAVCCRHGVLREKCAECPPGSELRDIVAKASERDEAVA